MQNKYYTTLIFQFIFYNIFIRAIIIHVKTYFFEFLQKFGTLLPVTVQCAKKITAHLRLTKTRTEAQKIDNNEI